MSQTMLSFSKYLCAYLKQAQTHMFIKSAKNHALVNKTHFFLN